MKRRRQIGGGEEYSGSAKDNEALSVGILLWRIRASKALEYLASSEEFAEVEACEGTALVRPDGVWFESTEETKQGGELGNERLEAAGRSGGVELAGHGAMAKCVQNRIRRRQRHSKIRIGEA